jgi:hypothetical protein
MKVITVGLIAIIIVSFIFVVMVLSPPSSPPAVDAATMQSCSQCLEQFNLTFTNPVEAFYWLTLNEQKDPEIIIMKYRIAPACYSSCIIPDREESKKMIKRVMEYA